MTLPNDDIISPYVYKSVELTWAERCTPSALRFRYRWLHMHFDRSRSLSFAEIESPYVISNYWLIVTACVNQSNSFTAEWEPPRRRHQQLSRRVMTIMKTCFSVNQIATGRKASKLNHEIKINKYAILSTICSQSNTLCTVNLPYLLVTTIIYEYTTDATYITIHNTSSFHKSRSDQQSELNHVIHSIIKWSKVSKVK